MEDFSKYNGEGTTLRRLQLKMLDILCIVDSIFRKHNIPYALEGGTCLGAVRHKGFIPWDDDLDILVRREDMHKIREVLIKELPNDLVFQDKTTDPYYFQEFVKVRDRYSYVEEHDSVQYQEKGIYIDIIPYEHVVAFSIKQFIDYVYIHCMWGIRRFVKTWYEILLGYLCYLPCMLIVLLCRCWTKLFHTKQMGHVYGWRSYHHMPEDYIFPPKEIEFEGKKFYGPNNPDAFLRSLFGDYMQIPPKEKREQHFISIIFDKTK